MSTITPAGERTPPADDNQGRTPPTDSRTAAQPPTPSEGDESRPMSEAAAAKLREENKQRRMELDAARAELKKLQDAQLSESERAQKRLADLEAKEANHQREMQELRVQQTVERLALKLNIIDPEAAARLLDWSELTFDKETGQPTNAEHVLKALVKNKPYLAGQPGNFAPSISPTNPGSAQGKPIFTLAQLEDFEFAMKHDAEIKQAMREGRIQT